MNWRRHPCLMRRKACTGRLEQQDPRDACFSIPFLAHKRLHQLVFGHELARGTHHTLLHPQFSFRQRRGGRYANSGSSLCASNTIIHPDTPGAASTTVGSGLSTSSMIMVATSVRAADTSVRPESGLLPAPRTSGNLHCGQIYLAKKPGARRKTWIFLPRDSTCAAEAPKAPPTLDTPGELRSSPLFAFTHPTAQTRLPELAKAL